MDVVQQVVHDYLPTVPIVATPIQEALLVDAVRAQYHPRCLYDVLNLPRLVYDTVARDWLDIVLESSMHCDAATHYSVPDYSIVYVH